MLVPAWEGCLGAEASLVSKKDNCPTLTYQKYVPCCLWTSNGDNF